MGNLGRVLEQDFDYYLASNAEWRPEFCSPERWLGLGDNTNERLLAHCKEMNRLQPNGSLVVLDGYGFDAALQERIREAGSLLMCVDDYRHQSYSCDFILSHVPGLSPQNFDALPETVFFLGPSYAMINPIFFNRQTEKVPNTVVISLGGSDPSNATLKILETVSLERFKEINIILGPANRFEHSVASAMAEQEAAKIHKGIGQDALAEIYSRSSCAVLSASTVCYEYIASGGGFLGIVQTADNQVDLYKHLLKSGAACAWRDFTTLLGSEDSKQIEAQRGFLQGDSAVTLRDTFRTIRQTLIEGSAKRPNS